MWPTWAWGFRARRIWRARWMILPSFALCVPGRLHRGDEDVGDGPEPEYEKKEDEDPLQRFSVVTNEPETKPSELRQWARDAHDALHALGSSTMNGRGCSMATASARCWLMSSCGGSFRWMRTRARHSYPGGSSCRAARLQLYLGGRRGRRPPTTLPRSRMRLHLHRSASATTSPSSSTLVDCGRAATRTNNRLYR